MHYCPCLDFKFDDEPMLIRFRKAFVGKVVEVDMSYNIQDIFDMEGFFNIITTPLGANLCLLEGRIKGVVEELLGSDSQWLVKWFSNVKP